MSQTSERAEPSELAEQIWCGWSKFGVGGVDVGRTVWRVADNLEKTLLCKFLFSWAKFLKIDTYICDRTCEKGPCRASFQNRVITAIGKSRL